ncbi:MAG: tRNA (adenosine(37)-N6)-dimethylallyltransferase MiaA, partial [Alphaproteobacteria bacterium]
QMMRGPAVEEVRILLAKNPPADSLVLKALGVSEIKAFLNGEMTWDQAVDHACRMTRNYAKRQTTWFRHRFAADYAVDGVKSRDILTKALHFLE